MHIRLLLKAMLKMKGMCDYIRESKKTKKVRLYILFTHFPQPYYLPMNTSDAITYSSV